MISPKKSLGQHFLKDHNVARKIAQSLRLKENDVVVEIGPGKGELTRHLVNHCATVIGVEIDARASKLLRESLGNRVQVINQDVLTVRLSDFLSEQNQKLRIVGNIPYYITSEILFWLYDQKEILEDAALLMQFEVAQRLVAKPKTKDYGILSVFTQLYTRPKLLFKVSRNCFFPKPHVDSAVVHLDFSTLLPSCDLTLLKNIVRATFGKRRKMVRNGLKDLAFTEDQLNTIHFDLNRRPEDLSLDDFLSLTRQLETFEHTAVKKFRP
jgi:16S rRNA (adenine1518-N6/adenine1519-N6)-dimethyltransferase